jgi:hypothetical protein
MQPNDAVDSMKFGRLDELAMGNRNCEMRTIERCHPKSKEVFQRPESRKAFRSPTVSLEQPVMIGTPATRFAEMLGHTFRGLTCWNPARDLPANRQPGSG